MLEVDDVQGDEFGAAERADVAHEQECAVPDASRVGAAGGDEAGYLVGAERGGLAWGGAFGSS